MNCPECGHPAEEHVSLIGCIFQTEDKNGEPVMECECSASRAEIECDAWQAEALAAREYIVRLEEFILGEVTEFASVIMPDAYNAYLAARVNEKETPC